MDISSINSDLVNYMSTSASSEAEENNFQSVLEEAVNSQDDEQLRDACQQYEEYFLNELFDVMRETIPESNLLESSSGSETYDDMLYEAYAKEIATGRGTGIADILYKQLSDDE
jgi:flagellar protein FlgJ